VAYFSEILHPKDQKFQAINLEITKLDCRSNTEFFDVKVEMLGAITIQAEDFVPSLYVFHQGSEEFGCKLPCFTVQMIPHTNE
jgi:hypothetical protein